MGLLQEQLVKLSNSDDVGLLSIGLLMALWSSSAAMVSIIQAMNRAYDIEETRSWWKVRLTAILLTIGLAVFILTSFTLVIAGPQLADFLGRQFGFAPARQLRGSVRHAWSDHPDAFVFLHHSIGDGDWGRS